MTTNQLMWLDQDGLRVGGTQLWTSGGGVGIGTNSIAGALSVGSTAYFAGTVGVGTVVPPTGLYVQGTSATNTFQLLDAAVITPDFTQANNFAMTIGGNRTLANPNLPTVGQSGIIYVSQDATGGRSLVFGSYWKFPGGSVPTLTATANATDALVCTVRTITSITVNTLYNIG